MSVLNFASNYFYCAFRISDCSISMDRLFHTTEKRCNREDMPMSKLVISIPDSRHYKKPRTEKCKILPIETPDIELAIEIITQKIYKNVGRITTPVVLAYDKKTKTNTLKFNEKQTLKFDTSTVCEHIRWGFRGQWNRTQRTKVARK